MGTVVPFVNNLPVGLKPAAAWWRRRQFHEHWGSNGPVGGSAGFVLVGGWLANSPPPAPPSGFLKAVFAESPPPARTKGERSRTGKQLPGCVNSGRKLPGWGHARPLSRRSPHRTRPSQLAFG